jgi:hypothetical protein
LKQGDVSNGEPCLIHGAPLVDHTGHIHPITGGDAETRPVNTAVHYIIKFRSAPKS